MTKLSTNRRVDDWIVRQLTSSEEALVTDEELKRHVAQLGRSVNEYNSALGIAYSLTVSPKQKRARK